MTKDQAKEVKSLFDAIGGFSSVEISMVGWDSGVYEVHLWCVNAKRGNRTVKTVRDVVDAKAAKVIAREAKGKATKRDLAAKAYAAAEKSVNAE